MRPTLSPYSIGSASNAHVYGASMGGRVAQMLAAEYPSRVDRLVLACTSPGGVGAVERTKEIRDKLGSPELREATLLALFYSDSWIAAPPRASTLLGDPAMTARAARLHLRVSDKHDASALLPRIRTETLVLHGSDDRMVPTANAPVLADLLPAATLEIWDGGRHGFFDEFPAVTDRVTEFLSN